MTDNPAPAPAPAPEPRQRAFPMPWLVVVPAIAVVVTLLVATPGNLADKADLVGYAVCHRISSHSISIAGRQLPLCARCTGTFIGAAVGFLGQAVVLRRRRASEFPPPLILTILVGFILLWAGDGLNSYMELVGGSHLYEPQNWLRLSTGSLNGLAMSALVYPVFNFTLWRNPSTERTIRGIKDLGVLVLMEAGLVVLVIVRWPPLLYPLVVLSAAGVLTLLTVTITMLVLMITRRENAADNWRQSVVPLLAGFTLSLILVTAIDLARYVATGTLTGIPPLQ